MSRPNPTASFDDQRSKVSDYVALLLTVVKASEQFDRRKMVKLLIAEIYEMMDDADILTVSAKMKEALDGRTEYQSHAAAKLGALALVD